MTASPALPGPGQPNIDVTLALGSDRRDAKARLADGGDVLILYLAEDPDQRLVYQRAAHRIDRPGRRLPLNRCPPGPPRQATRARRPADP